MALAPPPIVDVSARIARPYPAQQILWPSVPRYEDGGQSDASAFPSLTDIKIRRATCPPKALTAFADAASLAQDRIFVLDDYLFEPHQEGQSRQSRYDQILEWLPDTLVANNIRFLTNAHEDQAERSRIQELFSARALAIKQRVPRRSGEPRIEIRFTLGRGFPYVHDRFAIVDDELWHFGATVGGLHHLVNAATRGWDAEALGAVRFLDEAWEGDADAQRRGRRG